MARRLRLWGARGRSRHERRGSETCESHAFAITRFLAWRRSSTPAWMETGERFGGQRRLQALVGGLAKLQCDGWLHQRTRHESQTVYVHTSHIDGEKRSCTGLRV